MLEAFGVLGWGCVVLVFARSFGMLGWGCWAAVVLWWEECRGGRVVW